MNKVVSIVVASIKELWSLLVDDGLLAIAALAAIGVAYLLSRDGVMGPVDAVGWILIAIVVVSMIVSVRRAIAARSRSDAASFNVRSR